MIDVVGRAVADLGGRVDGEVSRLVERLVARYEEPQRSYHDARHLAEVLAAVEELRAALGAEPQALAVTRLAAGYHDAVYDPRAAPGANEEASARLAEGELAGAGVDVEAVAEVAALVRATAAHELPGPRGPEAVLHDADLWILSSPAERYDAYAAQVRAEYAHVPDLDFARGRAAILAPFAERERLYATDHAHGRWTAGARANLARELDRLTP